MLGQKGGLGAETPQLLLFNHKPHKKFAFKTFFSEIVAPSYAYSDYRNKISGQGTPHPNGCITHLLIDALPLCVLMRNWLWPGSFRTIVSPTEEVGGLMIN
jgi:hypothetical protein